MRGLPRNIAQEVFESHQARRAAEDIMTDLGFDINHQYLEDFEGLGLVLD